MIRERHGSAAQQTVAAVVVEERRSRPAAAEPLAADFHVVGTRDIRHGRFPVLLIGVELDPARRGPECGVGRLFVDRRIRPGHLHLLSVIPVIGSVRLAHLNQQFRAHRVPRRLEQAVGRHGEVGARFIGDISRPGQEKVDGTVLGYVVAVQSQFR